MWVRDVVVVEVGWGVREKEIGEIQKHAFWRGHGVIVGMARRH